MENVPTLGNISEQKLQQPALLVHSILGVIANTPYETDSRLYKVEATIQNAFGASYDAVMECVVKKVNSSTIQITNFNVY